MTGARLPLVLLAAGLPLAVGYQLVSLLLPLPKGTSRLLKFSLGSALGLGLASLTFWFWRWTGGTWPPPFLLGETALFMLAFVVLAVILKKCRPSEWPAGPSPSAPAFLQWTAWAAIGCGAWLFLVRVMAEPHGRWDAWAIWNLKARFLSRGGVEWSALFSPSLDWSHPDYPLFLPSTVARLWNYAGDGSWLWPAMAAGLLLAVLAGTLAGTLRVVKSPSAAAMGVIGLMGAWGFADRSGWQYADLPLALFMAASLACLALHRCRESRGLLVLAGAGAGLAAWTKNEGLLFIAALALAWLADRRVWAQPRRALTGLAWMAVGALPALCAVAAVKFQAPAANDLAAAWTDPALPARLGDPARAGLIAKSFLLEALKFVTPAAFLAAWGFAGFRTDPRTARAGGFCLAVTGLCLLGYGAVYMATPHDLAWHLATSAPRTLSALWPAGLLGFLLTARMD